MEDLRPQLLEGKGVDLNSESEEPIPKDGRDEAKTEPARKRARLDGDKLASATTISINGLVVEMQGVRARMSKKESHDEKTDQAIVDATSVLSKLVDSVNRLRSSIEDSSKEEKRSEGRSEKKTKSGRIGDGKQRGKTGRTCGGSWHWQRDGKRIDVMRSSNRRRQKGTKKTLHQYQH